MPKHNDLANYSGVLSLKVQNLKLKKLLIIGGGFGGCAAIHEFSQKSGWDITLVEPNPELGAGVRTRFKSGHPYTFGPRHFLTQKDFVYDYICSHLEMRLCGEHQFISFVENDSQFYNYPIHYDDIKLMPESKEIFKEIFGGIDPGAPNNPKMGKKISCKS